MKKIFTVFILFIFFVCNSNAVYAKKSGKIKMPSIKYKGSVYSLYYSEKSKELGGYLNEYYKSNETYTNWSELIALHHYPRAYSPIEHARDFLEYFDAKGIQANLEVNDEENTAVIDFIIISKQRLPIILEYNIFRFEKGKKAGTVGLQYAQRYMVNNPLEIDKAVKKINKKRNKKIKSFQKCKFPDVITDNVDKGVYVSKEDTLKFSKSKKKSQNTELAPTGKLKEIKIRYKYDDPVQEFFNQNGEMNYGKKKHAKVIKG